MYLVTGGSGFCGWEIVNFLLKKGEKVRVIDVEALPEPLSGVEFVKGDIRDLETLIRVTRDIDFVIHCAAKVPVSKAGKLFWEINAGGTRNVLEAALRNQVRKFIHISTSALIISDQNPVLEDAPYHPIGAYAKSKMEAELICREYMKKGMKVDIIRPRTVLGPGRLGIFSILFDWIADGKKVYLLGKGENKIQFLHSEDLAACAYLASRTEGSEIYNIGSREYGPLKDDLQFLIDHAQSRSNLCSLPIFPAMAMLAVLDVLRLSPLASFHYRTYFRDFYFSNEKAKRLLHWEPQFGNREIFALAYDDFLAHRHQGKGRFGTSHRKALEQGVLKLIKKMS